MIIERPISTSSSASRCAGRGPTSTAGDNVRHEEIQAVRRPRTFQAGIYLMSMSMSLAVCVGMGSACDSDNDAPGAARDGGLSPESCAQLGGNCADGTAPHGAASDSGPVAQSDGGSRPFPGFTPRLPPECGPVLAGPGLRSIFALPTGEVLAGGEEGRLIARVDGAWRCLEPVTARQINAIWATGVDDIYFATNEGLYHWDGHDYTLLVPEVVFADVFGLSRDEVWAVGQPGGFEQSGVVYRGGAESPWTLVHTVDVNGRYARDLNSVWAAASDDVWAAGNAEDGALYHFDGAAWNLEQPTGPVTYSALHGRGADDVWLVGFKYFVAHFDGREWRRIDAPGSQYVDAVLSAGPGEAWVAGDDFWGDGGALWRAGAGDEVVRVELPALETHHIFIEDFAAAPNGEIWAAASSFLAPGHASKLAVFHYDGEAWTIDLQFLDENE